MNRAVNNKKTESDAHPPGFRHVARVTSAVDLQHVTMATERGAHRQEVGTRTTYGEFRQVGQRLTDGPSEHEGAHHLVEGRQVLVELGVGAEAFGVHQVGLSRGDLLSRDEGAHMKRDAGKRRDETVCPRGRRIRSPYTKNLHLQSNCPAASATHNDNGADDRDRSHGPVGDGVFSVRIADALVIAVDSLLVRAEQQRQDGRRQSGWRENRSSVSPRLLESRARITPTYSKCNVW